jgi:hypothetical protein
MTHITLPDNWFKMDHSTRWEWFLQMERDLAHEKELFEKRGIRVHQI